MTRRLWPLLLIPILVVWLAATSRPAADIRYGLPGAITTQQRTEASHNSSSGVDAAEATSPVPTGRSVATPHPSGGIGEPASYCKPGYCETPQPRIVDRISGSATWWNTFGGGFYVALRPDLGSKGDLVIVCGPVLPPGIVSTRGVGFHCRTAPVITSCACLGPNSERLVDLSRDLFSEFADPSRGTVRVVIQVVPR